MIRLETRLRKVIEQCGLGDVSRRVVGTLSRGFRQRTGLADCLLHEPDVLLLDEPLAGLDPAQVRVVRELLAEFAQRRAVLFSTHVLAEAEQLCHRALILNAGRLAAADAPARLAQAAGAADFEEAFLQLTTPLPLVRNSQRRKSV
ncbi:MAG TPA: ATP-binding cassette domain-containing protein, partial [Kiritimatiellia bacterium]|nr:ATP-binding cassette domain-containing protein [Kiritimatiellia bacterium]